MIFRQFASVAVVCEVPFWHKNVDEECMNFGQNSLFKQQIQFVLTSDITVDMQQGN